VNTNPINGNRPLARPRRLRPPEHILAGIPYQAESRSQHSQPVQAAQSSDPGLVFAEDSPTRITSVKIGNRGN